ncbi:hypothetical protein D3C81_1959090 [compost metagenome]
MPRGHGDNAGQCQDVEQDDPQRNRVDRFRQGFLRRAGFGGGGADQLGAGEGEDRHLKSGEETEQAVRERCLFVHQVTQGRGDATGRDEGAGDQHGADADQCHDGNDLDDREPEFHFTEQPYGQHV